MMEIPETIKVINDRLKEYFGVFENGEPNFRIVWSDDQTEKQLFHETKDGFHLLTPEIGIGKKYNYIQSRFVLERITPVPESANKQLLGLKLSYEPIWVFEDAEQNPLPPVWDVVNILVKTLLDQRTYMHGPYKQAEGEGNTAEEMEYKAQKLEEALYGNESKITDALAVGEAVGYGTYRRNDTRFNNNPIKSLS